MKLTPSLPRRAWPCRAAVLVLALGSLALSIGAQEQDAIFLRDGSSEACKVLEESWIGVTIQPEKGPKKTLAWGDVRSIEYFDATAEFSGGLTSLAAGNAESALEQLAVVLQDGELRPVLRQEVEFHAAYCMQRLGKTADAQKLYEKVLSENPRGRYLRMIGENLVDLHLAGGDGAAAKAAIDKLAEGAKGVEGVEALAQLLEGRLLERQGKHAEAQQLFTALEGSPVADLAQEGKLGKARTMLRQSKGAEAEPLLRALIADSKSARVQSGAWNGIGELFSAEGRSKKEAERIQDGLYAYLRTIVQYKPLPGESTEEYERALAGAATCFEYLSQLEPNADKKKLWRERQRERLEQLQQEYPASSFLKKS